MLEATDLNQTYKTKSTQPSLTNQALQAKPLRPNLPNQTFQTKFTKSEFTKSNLTTFYFELLLELKLKKMTLKKAKEINPWVRERSFCLWQCFTVFYYSDELPGGDQGLH